MSLLNWPSFTAPVDPETATAAEETAGEAALLPERALLTPAWVASLAVLGLNDHLLKGSGAWPALSGKLSDVAGLLVAPLVLAWMARVRTRRGFLACHVAVGLVFALHPVPAIATWLMAWFPVRIWADPTDLYALPALAVSFFVRKPTEPEVAEGDVTGPHPAAMH